MLIFVVEMLSRLRTQRRTLDAGGKTVDVAYSEFKQVNMSKKEFMALMKIISKNCYLFKRKWKKDRVDGFKKGDQAFIKYIIPKYDEIELYTDANRENDDGEIVGGICISYWEDEEVDNIRIYIHYFLVNNIPFSSREHPNLNDISITK